MMPADLLEHAERATGFMPTAEGLALHAAAREALPRGPVLEVGTYCGKSTIFLAAAAQEIGGVVVTESVFNIPGLGRLTVDAVLGRDYPTIQAVILLFSAVYVLINLLIDLSYTFLDPRIRY